MTNDEKRRSLGNVCVATDLSEGAHNAIERAATLPLGVGSSVALLHVMPEVSDASETEQLETLTRQCMEDIRQTVARRLETSGTGARDVLLSLHPGKPFVEIVRNARHGKAELIVVGRHGERTFLDLLIGSTAERVIRKGDVSVLVVAAEPASAYRKPLVAIDMSDSSGRALELTLAMLDSTVEALDVVHVISLPSAAHVSNAALVMELEQRRAESVERARGELSEFLVSRGGAAMKWNVVIRTGDPRQIILEEAKQRGSDLVALGTQGRTGLAHILVGSVAEAVLRSASCDVLVARLPRVDFSLP